MQFYPHVIYTFKNKYQFFKTEIGDLIFDMGIAGFEHHMKEKGVEQFWS